MPFGRRRPGGLRPGGGCGGCGGRPKPVGAAGARHGGDGSAWWPPHRARRWPFGRVVAPGPRAPAICSLASRWLYSTRSGRRHRRLQGTDPAGWLLPVPATTEPGDRAVEASAVRPPPNGASDFSSRGADRAHSRSHRHDPLRVGGRDRRAGQSARGPSLRWAGDRSRGGKVARHPLGHGGGAGGGPLVRVSNRGAGLSWWTSNQPRQPDRTRPAGREPSWLRPFPACRSSSFPMSGPRRRPAMCPRFWSASLPTWWPATLVRRGWRR